MSPESEPSTFSVLLVDTLQEAVGEHMIVPSECIKNNILEAIDTDEGTQQQDEIDVNMNKRSRASGLSVYINWDHMSFSVPG